MALILGCGPRQVNERNSDLVLLRPWAFYRPHGFGNKPSVDDATKYPFCCVFSGRSPVSPFASDGRERANLIVGLHSGLCDSLCGPAFPFSAPGCGRKENLFVRTQLGGGQFERRGARRSPVSWEALKTRKTNAESSISPAPSEWITASSRLPISCPDSSIGGAKTWPKAACAH